MAWKVIGTNYNSGSQEFHPATNEVSILYEYKLFEVEGGTWGYQATVTFGYEDNEAQIRLATQDQIKADVLANHGITIGTNDILML